MALIVLLTVAIPTKGLADATRDRQQFLQKARFSFSTKGHPKAKGVELTITYPRTWVAEEGDRPNIVQKLISDGGRGLALATIVVKDLGLPAGTDLSPAEQQVLLAPEEVKNWLPADVRLIDATATKIEQIPATVVEYTQQMERLGQSVAMHFWCVFFLHQNMLVTIAFQVGGPASNVGQVSEQMVEYMPLFRLMANSIVLPGRWNKYPGQSKTIDSPNETSFALVAIPDSTTKKTVAPAIGGQSTDTGPPSLSVGAIAASFLATWLLGLGPALLIRYAFVGQPLCKKSATLIAVGFAAFFWLLFRILFWSMGEKSDSGVVWLIVAAVSEWILNRGYVDPGRGSKTAQESLSPKWYTVRGWQSPWVKLLVVLCAWAAFVLVLQLLFGTGVAVAWGARAVQVVILGAACWVIVSWLFRLR